MSAPPMKCRPAPDQDDRPHLGLGLGAIQRPRQAGANRVTECVDRWVVDSDDQDVVDQLGTDDNAVGGWGLKRCSASWNFLVRGCDSSSVIKG